MERPQQIPDPVPAVKPVQCMDESSNQNLPEDGKQNAAVPTPFEPIDKVTAFEMLQLLKEYKKREYLYIAEITMLQKELSLMSSTNLPFNVSPSNYYTADNATQLALFDPAVNLEIRQLRYKLYEQATELQKAKDELKAATFSADSVMGRRLINKCKALQQENADIGKMMLETCLQPFQIQTGVLQKQLKFFKLHLGTMYEMNADAEDENEKLATQLQELTLLLKNATLERDSVMHELKYFKSKYGHEEESSEKTTSQRHNEEHPRSSSLNDSETQRLTQKDKYSAKRREASRKTKRGFRDEHSDRVDKPTESRRRGRSSHSHGR